MTNPNRLPDPHRITPNPFMVQTYIMFVVVVGTTWAIHRLAPDMMAVAAVGVAVMEMLSRVADRLRPA